MIWLGAVFVVVLTLTTAAKLAMHDYSPTRLSELLEKSGRKHKCDAYLKSFPLLILTMGTIRMAALIATVLVTDQLCSGYFAGRVHGAVVFVVCLGVFTLFGVAIPGAWSRYSAEAILATGIPMMSAVSYVLYPVSLFLQLFDGLVRRLVGVPKGDARTEVEQIGQEIRDAISEGERQGAVVEVEKEMIESVIELRDQDVEEIMTPRTEMVAIDREATLTEAKDVIKKEGHSRIPVYEESVDSIVGVLYAKDLLHVDDEGFDAAKVMRKVPYIPCSKRLLDLLHEFQNNKVHLAIVLDEYGGTAGLVTIEDILEEVFGEIADEYEQPEPEAIQRIDDDCVEVDARTHIDEVNEELDIKLPEEEDYETIGGFVFSAMGRIPVAGEEFEHENVKFKILDAEDRKVNRVRVEVCRNGKGE